MGRGGHARQPDHVPDDVYDEARTFFDEAGLVNLTLGVVAINGWNRFAVAARVPPALGKAHG